MKVTLERKYTFAEGNRDLILTWLASMCSPDPSYRGGRVNSLYYDSLGFRLYQEKRGSDFLKVKFRLRWYGTLEGRNDDETVPCYLETKAKEGACRNKDRQRVSVQVGDLRRPYTSAFVQGLPERLLGQHPSAVLPLHPLLVVSYRRDRFVAPELQARISVDSAIACLSANPALLSNAEPTRIDVGVLETKSPGRELSGLVWPVKQHLRRAAFSKYARLLEAMDQPMGVRI